MVKAPHLLLAGGNARKIKENLAGILDTSAIQRIEDEIQHNSKELFYFAREHYQFAKNQSKHWRQCVSRLYYAAYNCCRAVRLLKEGAFSQDVSDHQKIGQLPDDFPDKTKYLNQLPILRKDRNLCDYDHLAVEDDLILSIAEALTLTEDLLRDTESYFRRNGVSL